jgi:outer membrane lipoprotein SlyB
MAGWRAGSGIVALLGAGLGLGACAAAQTAIGYRELDVQTRASDTIFLDPVPEAERTVLVAVRNTSDKPELDLDAAVRDRLVARGYRVVEDREQARYVLQVNVLQAGREAVTAAREAYRSGFGSALAGAAVGGAAGYGAGRAGGDGTVPAIGGALAGAAIGTVADSFVQRVEYAVITDVQVAERLPSGVVVTEVERGSLRQGSSGRVSQSIASTSEWKRYRTRMVSTAERTNLDWQEAAPQLAAGLSRSIAGIF